MLSGLDCKIWTIFRPKNDENPYLDNPLALQSLCTRSRPLHADFVQTLSQALVSFPQKFHNNFGDATTTELYTTAEWFFSIDVVQ